MSCPNKVINADYLGVVEGRMLEKVGSIVVFQYFYIYTQLFLPFTLEAIDNPLSPIQSPARKLDHLAPAYLLFIDQYLVLVDPDAIYTYVKPFLHMDKDK